MTGEQTPWGRVDDTGTVFVREGDSERAVGQYPDGTADEALAYFERKYTELAGQVTLLEQRVKRGTAGADVAGTIAALKASIASARAVGDLAALSARLDALDGAVGELTRSRPPTRRPPWMRRSPSAPPSWSRPRPWRPRIRRRRSGSK